MDASKYTIKVLYKDHDFRIINVAYNYEGDNSHSSIVVQHHHEDITDIDCHGTGLYDTPGWAYCWSHTKICSLSHCKVNVPKEVIALHILLTMDNEDLRT